MSGGMVGKGLREWLGKSITEKRGSGHDYDGGNNAEEKQVVIGNAADMQ
jgi:hypothetical protein